MLIPQELQLSQRFGIYRLGFPNREVEVGDYDSFFRCLQSFFADTPYKMVRELELHCQNILFIVFKLVGFYVKVEYHTVRGRVVLVLQTDRFIYVWSLNWMERQKKHCDRSMKSVMHHLLNLTAVNCLK